MKSFRVVPQIHMLESVAEFAKEFQLGKQDLILTNQYIYEPYFGELSLECEVIYQENFGQGEPSDDMVDAICAEIQNSPSRIIAIGGGTIIDIAKVLALKNLSPLINLYDGITKIEKEKELVIVPTTCGTGSEVTNVAVFSLHAKGTKKGLADDQLYAHHAVLIPELLKGLPFKVFMTSSVDALIHAVESTLSPKSNDMTRLLSYKAIEIILNGYKDIVKNGEDARFPLLGQFLLASNYAGIAFGNAGCAAVHALSYPIGSTFHVPHGKSNYSVFTNVLRAYIKQKRDGEIAVFIQYLAKILKCEESKALAELETILNQLLPKKPLHEYGMKESQISEFTESVIENQQRLLANNFVFLDYDHLKEIYQEAF